MKLYHHTQTQEQTLLLGIQSYVQELAGLQFEDPANDHRMIRRQAYVKGKLDQLVELLRDDYPDPAATAAAQQLQQLQQPE